MGTQEVEELAEDIQLLDLKSMEATGTDNNKGSAEMPRRSKKSKATAASTRGTDMPASTDSVPSNTRVSRATARAMKANVKTQDTATSTEGTHGSVGTVTGQATDTTSEQQTTPRYIPPQKRRTRHSKPSAASNNCTLLLSKLSCSRHNMYHIQALHLSLY
jgi:hypothetical protein